MLKRRRRTDLQLAALGRLLCVCA